MDVLGIDIGNVIIDGGAGGDTSFFGGDHLRTPAMAGALEAIARLSRERFGGRVHLVSKAYPRTEARTRQWLAARDFATVTGVPEDQWHFVKERPEKGPLCAALGITHFVDDKLENLQHARDHGAGGLYLFGGEPTAGDWFVQVADWPSVLALLLAQAV